MPASLIAIGESIHASIPKVGKVMEELAGLGGDAYLKESEPLTKIKKLIESQVEEGADYIAVNLDSFGQNNPQAAVDMMKEYCRMVRKWSGGIPVCVDSSNNEVLIAGLKEWYDTKEAVKPPLLNSVKTYTVDELLPLKKANPFSVIALLVSDLKPTGAGGTYSVDELYQLAEQIFDRAVNEYGFEAGEIFFDSTVFPLAIDMPMEPGVPGYTYRTFETMKRIRSDAQMKDAHCSLGISNCARDLPARKIGICRAYVAKAQEYGMDAGIVNVKHHYGSVEPASELVELVDSFAVMDGSMDKMSRAMQLMSEFCQKSRV